MFNLTLYISFNEKTIDWKMKHICDSDVIICYIVAKVNVFFNSGSQCDSERIQKTCNKPVFLIIFHKCHL